VSKARSAGLWTARAGCASAAGGGDGRRAGVNSPERRRRLGEGADMVVGGRPAERERAVMGGLWVAEAGAMGLGGFAVG
jgi:hypothetical protein